MKEPIVIDHETERKQRGGRPPKTFDRATMEKLEQEYRLGEIKVKDLAKQYGMDPATLKSIADRLGWVRNLRGRVAQHVYAKLHGAEPLVRPTFTQEEAIVEHAALNAVQLIQEHMQTTHHVFQLTGVAAKQLEHAMGSRDAIEQLIIEETRDADVAEGRAQAIAEKKRRAMLAAISLPTHVATLKDLSIAMKAVIELSRVLMGIHETPPPPPDKSDTPTVADERIEELRERLRLSFKQPAAAG